ncbi:Ribosomal protein arginine N-methyltransferase rmt3 [Elasticomyces elasticus]|nr:Ribosomal protein arginine N-methyltransferase rmt3 [Elasticomyces elasticus]KAK3635661.1 Ribosomal protein arginine N-methyltransferase rmt3 [Elasticomyces elasticus]KAK4933105.1 Ribosomal protein arginine N-methyltransferase rmt3 [Elasticomyces elasticus]KAK5764004.1 Ribosomal protein arginine N-methyltransferase rmt3 [Elasticomyces elasticus]
MENILPPGWRVVNNTGSWSAPAPPRQDDSSGSDDEGDLTAEDLRPDSPGWEDVEADEGEVASIKCLICEERVEGARKMVGHCKEIHSLDIDRIRKQHRLDFIATIQLINYIRSEVKSGLTSLNPSISEADLNPDVFKQDKYMQPVLEDDALLYSIDELADPEDAEDPLAAEAKGDDAEGGVDGRDGNGGEVVRAERVVVERALR